MAGHLEIHPLQNDQDGEYIAFLDELGKDDPSVLGYHYPFYRELIEKAAASEPFYLGGWRGKDLVAVLPGFIKHAKVGSVYCSMPFFGPNAGILCNRSRITSDEQKQLLGRAVDFLASQPVALSASFYTPFLLDDFIPYDQALPGALVVEKTTQYLHIPSFQPDKTLRYDLRKTGNSGIKVSRVHTAGRLEEFYAIYLQNCREAGIPVKPIGAIVDLFSAAAENDQVRIYYGLLDDRLISGLIVLCSPKTASYYLPCSLPEARSFQPGTLLIHHAMQEALEKGQVYWNWESSPSRDSGVYTFKKKWGSREANYRIYIQPFQPASRFKEMGAESIQRSYPYFYVYPFSSL